MTILAILLAALLGGVNNFALLSAGVGSGGPSVTTQAAPVAGTPTSDIVAGGGPVG
jgi:hypothetical protein